MSVCVGGDEECGRLAAVLELADPSIRGDAAGRGHVHHPLPHLVPVSQTRVQSSGTDNVYQ